MTTQLKGCIVLMIWCCVLWGSVPVYGETPPQTLYKQVIRKLENLSPENAIDVVLASKQEEYDIGDPFELRFRVSDACYVKLMHISVDGIISFLTPNVLTPDQPVEGMRIYSTRQDFHLPITVSPPEGVEVVNLFCTPKKFDFFQANLSEKEPFYIITPDDKTRLKDLLTRLDTLERIEWSGGGIQFQVHDASLLSDSRARKGITAPGEAGGFLPPIATTGSSGKDLLFPPLPVTGTTGHSENALGTD